jgi:hypothetical protein
MRLPINITGETYQSRSLPLSAQVTKNFYPEIQENQQVKGQYVLMPFPGLDLFSSGYDLVTTEGAVFDGTNDYLSRGASLTGAADGDFGTFVCRFKFADSSGTEMLFGMPLFTVYRNSAASHQLQITLESTAGDPFNPVLNHRTNTSFTGTDWINLMISWDANAAVGTRLKIYTGDTAVAYTNVSGSASTTLVGDYTQANFVIGAYTDFSSKFAGDIDFFWLDLTQSIDFSVEANRRKFFDSRGAPVSLGADGSTPTGTAPIVYLSGDAAEFPTNKGTGGGFTVTGTLTDSAGSTFPATPDRGMIEHKGVAYQVGGTTLYSINSAGTRTELSSGVVGTDRCIFDAIGDDIIIVSEGKAYVWDGATLTEITDADLETPNACAHLNNQIIFDGDDGRFAASEVGDASDIPALNYATAESNADDLKRPYVMNQTLYLMGDKTIEQWWNSGVGNPPFDRIEGGIIPVGLRALHSVADNGDAMYFLGHDLRVWAVAGTSKKIISTIPLNSAIQGYTDVDEAIGNHFVFENQGFYSLTFPHTDITWCFSEQSQQWFILESSEGQWLGSSVIRAYDKTLVSDYSNGNVYELDVDTFDENGETVSRVRDSGVIHSGLLGKPGVWMEMNKFEIEMETGVGALTDTPEIMLSWSDDGGRTYSTEVWGTVNVGTAGQYQKKIEWYGLGGFYNRIMRIRVSEPVRWSIFSANAEVEIGI